VRTFYRHDQSWIAGRGARRGVIVNQPPTPFQEDAGTPSPHELIDIAGSVAPYRRPTGPRTMGRELPPAAGESADVEGGWARETAGSGRVSGAMVHVSKRRHGT